MEKEYTQEELILLINQMEDGIVVVVNLEVEDGEA